MRAEIGSSRGELFFGNALLIYQMPKIGSQTIEATLRQGSFPYPIHRFHYLSHAFAETLKRGLAAGKPDPAWKQEAQKQFDLYPETKFSL